LLPSSAWEELGLTHTEINEQLVNIMAVTVTLDRAWRSPFSIKSNFARAGAFHVGICASEGFITTEVGPETWGAKWLITELGMEAKRSLDELLQDILAATKRPDGPTN